MTPDPRLNFLAERRIAAGLTQKEAAQRFGLAERQGYKSVAAWEKGERTPKPQLRARFLRYLWDDLQLHKEPTRFADDWAMLVECWHWEPLRADERTSLRLPPPTPGQERKPDPPLLPNTIVNGTLIGGNVTAGGDFVGRDKIVYQGFNADEVVKLLETAQRTVPTLTPVAVPTEWICQPFDPETVLVPAGPFLMGSPPGAGIPQEEMPQHRVDLPTAYRLGKFPVTNQEYAIFLKHNPAHLAPSSAGWFLRKPSIAVADQPVVGVDWHDAQAYCTWLSQTTGRAYRLPTEAEWEKAAHLALTTADGCQRMGDAIEEWTSTIWGDALDRADFPYPYRADDGREAQSAATQATNRVYRGGVATAGDDGAHLTARGRAAANHAGRRRGFRVALSV